jgi:hypothetical protein
LSTSGTADEKKKKKTKNVREQNQVVSENKSPYLLILHKNNRREKPGKLG